MGRPKGIPASEAQKAAGRANMAKGRATKSAALKAGNDRWSALLSGNLTVRDLDDEELKRGNTKANNGKFDGVPRTAPSHLAQAFVQEKVRRAQSLFHDAAADAVKELLAIAKDPDAKDGDRIRALQYIVDRGLGKTPETLNVNADTGFAALLREAVVERDLDDEAAEVLGDERL